MAITAPGQAADVVLRDGSTVHVRPAVAEDGDAIDALLSSLSPDSLQADGQPGPGDYGLVVSAGMDQALVAHAAYTRVSDRQARVIFAVADTLQGRGIATLLLTQLAQAANSQGIAELVGSVSADNARMLGVFRDSGFAVIERELGDSVQIRIPTALSSDAFAAFERREHTAAIGAVRSFLQPRSVAVVGASRRPRSVGGTLMRNIVAGGFPGPVYPINPNATEIEGRPCFGSVRDVPGPIDLAVIAVVAERVADVARECASAGVRALLVISAGFSEVGVYGRERQRQLIEICRQSGMRLIGPNCLGILNNARDVCLNATFAEHVPGAGAIGMMSQSGGVAIALAEAAARLSLGVSSFVSVGNKADISGNDLLEYWEQDPDTGVIALYLESFGNPRRFARLARRVGASTPILAVKSGRTPAGSRAASSHTAALLSASDTTVDALFRQAGVIRADTLGELLDTASLLSMQPLPGGNRVGIVTNGGGPGIMAADGCQAAGLEVVEFPEELRARLAPLVPPNAALGNPVDMTAAAGSEAYRSVIETLAEADACDAIITLFVPALETPAQEVAAQIDAASQAAPHLTIASVFMGAEPVPADGQAAGAGRGRCAARFMLPEEAVRSLAHAIDYARWRTRPQGSVPEYPDADAQRASAIIAGALARGDDWLGVEDLFGLLAAYGIPCVRTATVRTPDEAVSFAGASGRPVALKAIAPGLVHKSDAGGVRLDLSGAEQVRDAAEAMRQTVSAHGFQLSGWILQDMAPAGVELIVGVVHDPSFGPVVACGAGGTSAELLGDIAVRITPLTDVDAREMLRSLRTFPLLDGFRGSPRCDTAAVGDILTRVSALVHAHPEIAELDLNPVIVSATGALVSDARLRVQQREPEPPIGAVRR